MTTEDPEFDHRIVASEFLLETRIRYELNHRALPVSSFASEVEPAQDDARSSRPQEPAATELPAQPLDEERRLRAAAFLLATRSGREATAHTLLHSADGAASRPDLAAESDPPTRPPEPHEV